MENEIRKMTNLKWRNLEENNSEQEQFEKGQL